MTTRRENADDWKNIEHWRWDGREMNEIISRLEVINIHFFGMMKDWASTVPIDCRGSQFYISSANAYNSLEEIHSHAEIMAIDQSGSALVRRCNVNTYTGADNEWFEVMPLKDAREMVEDFKYRHQLQETAADTTLGEGQSAAWPHDYSIDP